MDKIPKIELTKPPESKVEFNILPIQELFEELGKGEIFKRPHLINFNILVFVTDGEGTHMLDFKSYKYKPGTVIFLAKGQVNSFEFNPNLRGYFMLFTEKFLGKNLVNADVMSYFSLYNYHMQSPSIHLDEAGSFEFLRIMQDLHVEFNEADDFAKEDILRSMLKVLLLKAERAKQRLPKSSKSLNYYREFTLFLDLLKNYYATSRSVKYYADLMGFSTKKLNMVVQNVIDIPAKQFIIEHVILEIKRLLTSTDFHIKEITYRTGFDEPTNLVKFFKRYVGETPTDFRKKMA